MTYNSRRQFLHDLGLSAAALPFVCNLPGLAWGAAEQQRKQRLVFIFTPNGTIPDEFWPDKEGELELKRILQPLEPFKSQTLTMHGMCDKIRGDGDGHMRGIGCLLTGIELFPGNIQGGSDTPAGWSSGLSIDQEIKNFLQAKPETRTRFGSLEFGVLVPERADTWTRMVYSGPNKPITPIDDPYQMFGKLYGRMKDRESLKSVLDTLQEDLAKVKSVVGAEDRRMLEEHASLVRGLEQELQQSSTAALAHAVPELEPGVREDNDNMPQLTKMNIELMVNSFANDFARTASLQFTNSVGGVRMRWIGVDEGHHELSHHGDDNEKSKEQLIKINTWFCEQIAYLAKRLAETPEPGGDGSLLDNTTLVWTNELGKGNSHTLDNIPFVLIGGGLGWKMGRAIKMKNIPHNRLLMSFAHAFGHHIEKFGNADFCKDGALTGLV